MMNREEIVRIFENLGFSIRSHSTFGQYIEMSAEETFVFSAVTGAKYLFYLNGITMKGRSEVFIHRSVFSGGHLIYSPGLFSQTVDGYIADGNTAFALNRKYPCVFKGNKKVIIVDIPENIPSNVEKDIYRKILTIGEQPEDFVVYKNSLSNNVGESLLEYFATLYFIAQGFLVENQVPWFQQNLKFSGRTLQGGIPDFSAFHSTVSNVLYANDIIGENRGIAVQLLPVLRLFRPDAFTGSQSVPEKFSHILIIGEAKTTASSLAQAVRQLGKYKSVNIADEFFTIIPDSKSNNMFGSMYIDSDYNIRYIRKAAERAEDQRIETDARWIDTYIKTLLLGNLEFADVIDFINYHRNKSRLPCYDKYKSYHLLDAVQSTDNDEFMQFIKDKI